MSPASRVFAGFRRNPRAKPPVDRVCSSSPSLGHLRACLALAPAGELADSGIPGAELNRASHLVPLDPYADSNFFRD